MHVHEELGVVLEIHLHELVRQAENYTVRGFSPFFNVDRPELNSFGGVRLELRLFD